MRNAGLGGAGYFLFILPRGLCVPAKHPTIELQAQPKGLLETSGGNSDILFCGVAGEPLARGLRMAKEVMLSPGNIVRQPKWEVLVISVLGCQWKLFLPLYSGEIML